MGRGERVQVSAWKKTAAILLGGLLALGAALLVLLVGAAAMAQGIVRQGAGAQVTAAACLAGGMVGGALPAMRWPARKLPAALGAGGVCSVLILLVGLMWGGLEFHALWALQAVCCVCGAALVGLLFARQRTGGGHSARRTRR